MVGALVPCSAGAQPQRGLPAHRIGWISTEAQPDPFVDGFREGLRRHGYVEGQSVAARALGLAVSYIPFTGGGQLDGGLSAVRDARADAMVVFPEGATIVARAKIAQFAIAERLPSMFGWSEYADAGGLMSYGANQREAYVRLAAYADKLLRGARIAELPIEQPTQFELVVNMRTAAALGITFPQATLLLANRRIE